MSGQATGQRPEVLNAFVIELTRLRASAGNPSFRRMAEKSGAVSHATLHLTVTGHRLQPWETVREFVRACDGDESQWHARWQRAKRELSGDAEPVSGPESVSESVSESARPGAEAGGPQPRAWWRSKRLLVPLALVVALCTGLGVATTATDGEAPETLAQEGPAYEGDASRFIRDVTIPDETVVEPGQQFVKVWELQNIGSVQWHNRYLRRTDMPLGPNDCRTPERIPVGETAQGSRVKISVDVTAPSNTPADCMVRWKMVDESGHKLFPSRRPVYFLVHVRDDTAPGDDPGTGA